MRLSVYLLRDRGQRIPLARVRASAPYDGYVRVTREPGGRMGQWSRMAMLMAEDCGTEVLLQLHHVQLQLWDSRGVVLTGTEVRWDRKRSDSYRQSWFIVFPHAADQPAAGPRRVAPEPARQLGPVVVEDRR